MNKKKVSDLIYNEFCCVLCGNCRYDYELTGDNGPNGWPCDDCRSVYSGWAVSRAAADLLAEKIAKMKE